MQINYETIKNMEDSIKALEAHIEYHQGIIVQLVKELGAKNLTTLKIEEKKE